MRPKSAALLWDILDHAEYILEKRGMITFQQYESSRDVRLAIERAFENIGEAARRLSVTDPEISSELSSLPVIIAFRNVLAHNYDQIDNARVWIVMSDHLPLLAAEARRLMPEFPHDA